MEEQYKEQYDELCEMIRGSSPNWTHKETLDRCAAQVDALLALEDPSQLDKNEISQHQPGCVDQYLSQLDKNEISQHQRDWMDKHTND